MKEIRDKSGLKQHTNTREVINWFNSLENKQNLKFIIFDIDSFYPSITPELLDRALDWAEGHVSISRQKTEENYSSSMSVIFIP